MLRSSPKCQRQVLIRSAAIAAAAEYRAGVNRRIGQNDVSKQGQSESGEKEFEFHAPILGSSAAHRNNTR